MATIADNENADDHASMRALIGSALRQVERADRSGSATALSPASSPDDRHAVNGAGSPLGSVAIPGYTLVREVHRGGQGVVFEGIQRSTQRRVAIKVMRNGPLATEAERTRFEREVRILAQLRHPNIVAIHDSGRTAEVDFYVMDLIDGRPLDVHVHALKSDLPARRGIEVALRLFAKVCHAVNAAHLRGVIHRDLKPRNVLVDSLGEPRVLDFGVAKVASESASTGSQNADDAGIRETEAAQLTETGQFIGSLPWSSPEQADGQPVDIRTDVYSLGVMLYQALTGRFPYSVSGRASEVIERIRSHDPARPASIVPAVDADLCTLVLKCLAKSPERRYQTAGDLARDIEHYLAGEPIEARRDSALYLVRKTIRRFRVPLAVLAGFVLLLVVSSIISWNLYLKMRRFAAAEQKANIEANEHLWQSYLNQVRLLRGSGPVDHRQEALELIDKAARFRPSRAVRNEAIAALALTELRVHRPFATVIEAHCTVLADAKLSSVLIQDDLGVRVLSTLDGRTLWSPPTSASLEARAITPDGHRILFWNVASSRYEVRHVEDSRPALEIDGLPADWVRFGPDSRKCALLSAAAARISLYDLETGTRIGELSIVPGAERFEFDAPGTRLATYSQDNPRVDIYYVDPPRHVGSFVNTESVMSLTWDATSQLLACGGGRGRIDIWNADQKLLASLLGHASTVTHLWFGADSARLYSSSWDGTWRSWDVVEQRERFRSQDGICGIHRDSARLLLGKPAGGGRVSLHLADVFEPDAFSLLAGPSPTDTVKRDACLSPDDRLLLSASFAPGDEPRRGGLRVFDTITKKQIAFLDIGDTRCVRFERSGRSFYCSGVRGFFRWPIHRDNSTIRIGPPQRLSDDMGRFDFSPDGKTCVVLGGIGRWKLTVLGLEGHAAPESVDCQVNAAYVAISPDGAQAAIGTWNGRSLEVWNLRTHTRLKSIPTAATASVAFLGNQRLVYDDGMTQLVELDTASWTERRRFDYPVHHLCVSPDGRLLLGLTHRDIPCLFDASSLEPLAEFEAPQGCLAGSVAFSMDGGMLVSGGAKSNAAYLWNLRDIRARLAPLGLDWDLPPLPPAAPRESPPDATPLTVEVDLGELANSEREVQQ